MPRRSTRQSMSKMEKSAVSHSTQEMPRKRPRPSSSSTNKKQGPKRSHYFKSKASHDDAKNDESEEPSDDHGNSSDVGSESVYGEVSTHESSSELPEEDDSDEQPKRKRKSTSTVAAQKQSASGSGDSELWREGASTGLPPGTQIIIKKPKARDAGKTPYSDGSIHPNTILFLQDLKANNDREWFKMHDPDYRASLNDWNTFVEVLTQKLIGIDELVPELPIKDITFRLHRDIRFSPDKTPYKPYFSAAWSRTGRKGPYAHYYVQISPGDSFVGGGLWHPEAQALAALRRDIDQNPRRLKEVLMGEDIREELLKGAPRKLEKVVQAFVSSTTNAETALKTKPRGYDTNHPDIDLLRLRNFTVGKKLKDSEVLDTQGFLGRVTYLFATIHPFVSPFLTSSPPVTKERFDVPWYSSAPSVKLAARQPFNSGLSGAKSSHCSRERVSGRSDITCLNRIVLPDSSDEEEEDDEGEESETSSTAEE